MSTPRLSICVPTLNRAPLLALGLENLLSEAAPFGAQVEVVVCDNASTDDTPEVLARFGDRIRVFRQPQSVVFPRQLLDLACVHARGTFVLFIGDDDLLVRGSVGKLLDLLDAHPELDYVYFNNGWISVPRRNRAIQEGDCRMPPDYQRAFQLKAQETCVLPRLEDVVALSHTSPYAMFSTIFCYAARRSLYLAQQANLQVLEDWDDRRQTLDNMFPHALLTLKACAGKPIGCIGSPVVLQGSWHQAWAPWSHKTMVHGHTQLFTWLEQQTSFDREVLNHLWRELAGYAGCMVAEMVDAPERHQGLELLYEETLPRLVRFPQFLEGLAQQNRALAQQDQQADALEAGVRARVGEAMPRIVLWGCRGRGERWLRRHPARVGQLCGMVDSDPDVQGSCRLRGAPEVKSPAVLDHLSFDVLVLALSLQAHPAVQERVKALQARGVRMVSLPPAG